MKGSSTNRYERYETTSTIVTYVAKLIQPQSLGPYAFQLKRIGK